MLGGQYLIGDYTGHNLTTFVDAYNPLDGTTTPAGTEIKPLFQHFTDYTTLNDVALRSSTGSYSGIDRVLQVASIAASIGWDVITLLSGTEIFYMLFLFGVPYIFVAGIEVVYLFFLIRTIIAVVRGV